MKLFIFALFILSAVIPAQAKDPMYWENPDLAADTIISYLKAGKWENLRKLIESSMTESDEDLTEAMAPLPEKYGKASVAETALKTDIGTMIRKNQIVARYKDNRFLFLKIIFMRHEQGWMIYSIDYTTDLNETEF
jgi:hypothetical protein